MNAKESMNLGTEWRVDKAWSALTVMLSLAKTGQLLTYQGLDQEISHLTGQPTMKVVVSYGRVLEIVGRSINVLSEEWLEEIPPLTILIVNKNKDVPSEGVDPFLHRYVSKSMQGKLTDNNRRAMIDRATNAVHNYTRWDEVAEYFGVEIPGSLSESDPISLDSPPTRMGGESEAHLKLKDYIANHPELFTKLGEFSKGNIEYRLPSGDVVDVLFQNEDMSLAVEVKTADAPHGELTRGIYQCVKYRAVLRAMHDVAGELLHVQTILATPQALPTQHMNAVKRLNISWQKVTPP